MPKSIKQPVLDYLASLKPELQKEGIVELGLFGSLAKNKATIYSDIDVFIKTSSEFCDKHGGFGGFSFLENLRQKISKKFKKEVDLCDIAWLKSEKREQIMDGAIFV